MKNIESIFTDEAYREWIQTQPSCISGEFSEYVNGEGRSIAAHVRRAGSSGTGYKAPYSCVPLTAAEHAVQHEMGEAYCLDEYRPLRLGKLWEPLAAKEYFDTWRAALLQKWLTESVLPKLMEG